MRRDDWPERLAAFVHGRTETPFAWGSNDCITFAFDAVAAMTGTDPIAAHRGTWHSALSAVQALEPYGGAGRGVLDHFLGPSMPPQFAQRGDVVVVENEGREVAAVCVGLFAAGPGENGITLVPMSAALASWGV
jgi:hypothetical protein